MLCVSLMNSWLKAFWHPRKSANASVTALLELPCVWGLLMPDLSRFKVFSATGIMFVNVFAFEHVVSHGVPSCLTSCLGQSFVSGHLPHIVLTTAHEDLGSVHGDQRQECAQC